MYYEKTKSKDQTLKKIHDAMTLAATTTIKGFRTKFDKQSTITNLKNGVGFLEEVCYFNCLQMDELHDYFWCWFSLWFCSLKFQIYLHYNANEKLEMSLEILQRISTYVV